jgi:hypothetical protein
MRFGGTTTVGLVCSDGTILASDSRATAGYLVASKEAKKIYKVSDHIATKAGFARGKSKYPARQIALASRLPSSSPTCQPFGEYDTTDSSSSTLIGCSWRRRVRGRYG